MHKTRIFKLVGDKDWRENISNQHVLQPELNLRSIWAAMKMRKLMGILNLYSDTVWRADYTCDEQGPQAQDVNKFCIGSNIE